MATIPVAIRRRKEDNVPELFFYEAPGELTCYAHVGQHSPASRAYIRECTMPADPADPDCAALIREWNGQPSGTDEPLHARIVKRLMRG
jgi:hypothetical protein